MDVRWILEGIKGRIQRQNQERLQPEVGPGESPAEGPGSGGGPEVGKVRGPPVSEFEGGD